jgi:hypothetical protein
MPVLRRACGGIQLKCFNEVFGREQRVGLRCAVIWCHDATHLIALDDRSRAALSNKGRSPAPWFALVRDYRKFGDMAIEGPQKTGSRRLVRDVNGKKRFHPVPHQTNGRQDGERRQSRSR